MNMISILGDLYGHFMCMGHNIIKQLHDIVFQRKNLWLESPNNLELFVGKKFTYTLNAHKLM